MISHMPHLRIANWFVITASVLLLGGAAALLAQPPLTGTPAAAPGYTNVVVSGPIKVVQDGQWMMRPSQDSVWTVKMAESPLRTTVDRTPPPFIRPQRSYVFTWSGTPGVAYVVSEVRPDGWVRASPTEGGRRRQLWINTRQLAMVEELP